VREYIPLFRNFYYHGIPSNVDAKFLFRGYSPHNDEDRPNQFNTMEVGSSERANESDAVNDYILK